MGRKRKDSQPELNTEILIGFVNSFKFMDQVAEKALNGHPKEGRLYQIVKDDYYGYRVHIGSDTNESSMNGILLGDDLSGSHDNKWDFDIEIVTKQNFLNFNICEEDTKKLQVWFETDNKDLKDVLGQPVHLVSSTESGEFMTLDDEGNLEKYSPEEFAEALEAVAKEEIQDQDAIEFADFTIALNDILFKDREFFRALADVISYLGSTYGDKYEDKKTPNVSKQMLLNSDSSDVALFNTLKYIQRYSTSGYAKSKNIQDLYKALHYILFELQRRKRNA